MSKFNENSIREAAYYNWQNAGCPNGQDEYFWSMAMEQLSSPSCSKKSCSSASKKTVSKSASASKTSTKSSSKTAACKTSSASKKSK